MFGTIGTTEIIIIVFIALLLFGNKEITKIVKSIVKANREIKNMTQSVKDDLHQILNDEDDYAG